MNLLTRLLEEKESRLRGGIYHRTQIDLDTCLAAQDEYKLLLKYFRIE